MFHSGYWALYFHVVAPIYQSIPLHCLCYRMSFFSRLIFVSNVLANLLIFCSSSAFFYCLLLSTQSKSRFVCKSTFWTFSPYNKLLSFVGKQNHKKNCVFQLLRGVCIKLLNVSRKIDLLFLDQWPLFTLQIINVMYRWMFFFGFWFHTHLYVNCPSTITFKCCLIDKKRARVSQDFLNLLLKLSPLALFPKWRKWIKKSKTNLHDWNNPNKALDIMEKTSRKKYSLAVVWGNGECTMTTMKAKKNCSYVRSEFAVVSK